MNTPYTTRVMTTYLITAANRGIGLEFARQLVEAGHKVIATARPKADLSELERLDVRVEHLDVTDSKSAAALAEKLASQPIDVLINNAGFAAERASFGELDVDSMLRSFDVNSLGAIRVSQSLLPNLRLGQAKQIIQISSKMGSMSDNSSGGAYPYRMSKAALNMFNTSLSVDLAGEGFACVLLHPGWVRTRMGGKGAPTSLEESVAGMRRVIDNLKPKDNGIFYDFKGERIAF